jgi:hypothetical protein
MEIRNFKFGLEKYDERFDKTVRILETVEVGLLKYDATP